MKEEQESEHEKEQQQKEHFTKTYKADGVYISNVTTKRDKPVNIAGGNLI